MSDARHFLVVSHTGRAAALEATADVCGQLAAAGAVPVVAHEQWHDVLSALPELEGVVKRFEEVSPRHLELAIVLGGDGTILRAARLVSDQRRPVLGINFGQLGFLTGFSASEAKPAIEAALAGKLAREQRMRLAVKFTRAGAEPVTRFALNDAVLHQGAMARLVGIDAFVDAHFVASYRADGLIVATPTGSTAYNMAAGGPIVVPGQAAMTMTPICAHALTNRPLVIHANATIRLQLGADVRGVILTVDAQWAHSFLPGDTVEMTAAAAPLILFASPNSFFDIMRDKLHWGARSDRKEDG